MSVIKANKTWTYHDCNKTKSVVSMFRTSSERRVKLTMYKCTQNSLCSLNVQTARHFCVTVEMMDENRRCLWLHLVCTAALYAPLVKTVLHCHQTNLPL